MSVISCWVTHSRSSGIDKNYNRKHKLVYRVITDDPITGGIEARSAVPFAIGQTYAFGTEFDTGSYCVNINADDEADDGKQWLVTVDFEPISNDIEENPFNVPWEISTDGQEVEVPYDVDTDGKPVVNSIGDPFSTQQMRQMSWSVLSITRNEAAYQPGYDAYANVINSDPFWGGPPGTVLCKPVKQQRDNSATYGFFWPTTFNFIKNMDGWDHRILNQGFRSRNPRGVYKQILIQGTPITEPALLTPSGDVLPRGVPPVVLTFKPYFKMPFSVLGL